MAELLHPKTGLLVSNIAHIPAKLFEQIIELFSMLLFLLNGDTT